ncbi:phosphate ABC transporter permease PstA [Rhodococcus aerolatus]
MTALDPRPPAATASPTTPPPPGAPASATTPPPEAAAARVLPPPRRPAEWQTNDVAGMVGCAVASALLVELVFGVLASSPGWVADLALGYVVFLLLLTVVTVEQNGTRGARDRIAQVVVITGAGLLVAPLASLVLYVMARGLPNLRPGFFTHDLAGITPDQPATEGGALHAIVGTLEQAGMALLVVLPLGVATAVFLNETRSRLRRPVRIVVDAMSGLPSIVAGLFIYAALIVSKPVDSPVFNFNGLMASLALSIIMLPTVTRTVDVVLRLVPDGLREASLALGASRSRTVWSVVLPTARSGITTAVVLGLARIVGETAPLLFTSFGNSLLNANPVAGPQESLPLYVYRFIKSAQQTESDRGYVGAVVLILVVLVLFVIARLAGRAGSSRLTRVLRRTRTRSPR